MKKIDWSKYFDRIFCLSLADNMERRNDCMRDWERLGIFGSGIFEWKITVNNPFYGYIWTNPNLPAMKWWLNLTGALNCTLGHYEIMMQSLAMGYERVLILEDDVRFLKDESKVAEILENMPEYDICLLDKFVPAIDVSKKLLFEAMKKDKVNNMFFSFDKCKLLSCACYALSRKAMQILTYEENVMWVPADDLTNVMDNYGNVFKKDGLTRVASACNIAIQDRSYKTYTSETEYYNDIFTYEGVIDESMYNVRPLENPFNKQ